MQRRLPLLGDAELVVPLPGADAVDDGEGRRVALGPLPAQGLHVGVVGRVELHDDRVDLAAVDATAIVDLVHVEVDRRDLLVVLLVLGEALLAGQAVDGDDREDDVDARGGDATGARAGLARRRGGRARRHLGRARSVRPARGARRSQHEPGHEPDDDGDDDQGRAHLHGARAPAQAPPGPTDRCQGMDSRPPAAQEPPCSLPCSPSSTAVCTAALPYRTRRHQGLVARTKVGGQRLRVSADHLGRSGGHHAAQLHHHDGGAQLEDQRHVVLHQDDGGVRHLVDPPQQRNEGLGLPLGDARPWARRAAAGGARPERWRRGRPPGASRWRAPPCGGGGSAPARRRR